MENFIADLNAVTDQDEDIISDSSVPQTVGGSFVPDLNITGFDPNSPAQFYPTPGITAIGMKYQPAPGAIVNLPYAKTPVYGHPSIYGGTVSTGQNIFPYAHLNLSNDDIKLIVDFKMRQPDFDSLEDEITLVLQHQPGLGNTPLFMSILYETAKKLHKICQDCIDSEGASGIVDGAPKKD